MPRRQFVRKFGDAGTHIAASDRSLNARDFTFATMMTMMRRDDRWEHLSLSKILSVAFDRLLSATLLFHDGAMAEFDRRTRRAEFKKLKLLVKIPNCETPSFDLVLSTFILCQRHSFNGVKPEIRIIEASNRERPLSWTRGTRGGINPRLGPAY